MRNSARSALLAFGTALQVLAGGAHACGVCVEDRVAAVYDHSVVEGAARRGHAVAFLALVGAPALDATHAQALRDALAAVKGAERATVRVSPESASCSVAFDPARASPETLVAEVNRRLARHGLTVAPLQVGTAGTALRKD